MIEIFFFGFADGCIMDFEFYVHHLFYVYCLWSTFDYIISVTRGGVKAAARYENIDEISRMLV